MKEDIIGILIIVIISLVIGAIAFFIARAIAISSMPDWLKFWLLK